MRSDCSSVGASVGACQCRNHAPVRIASALPCAQPSKPHAASTAAVSGLRPAPQAGCAFAAACSCGVSRGEADVFSSASKSEAAEHAKAPMTMGSGRHQRSHWAVTRKIELRRRRRFAAVCVSGHCLHCTPQRQRRHGPPAAQPRPARAWPPRRCRAASSAKGGAASLMTPRAALQFALRQRSSAASARASVHSLRTSVRAGTPARACVQTPARQEEASAARGGAGRSRQQRRARSRACNTLSCCARARARLCCKLLLLQRCAGACATAAAQLFSFSAARRRLRARRLGEPTPPLWARCMARPPASSCVALKLDRLIQASIGTDRA
jgi:hypothetical protein